MTSISMEDRWGGQSSEPVLLGWAVVDVGDTLLAFYARSMSKGGGDDSYVWMHRRAWETDAMFEPSREDAEAIMDHFKDWIRGIVGRTRVVEVREGDSADSVLARAKAIKS